MTGQGREAAPAGWRGPQRSEDSGLLGRTLDAGVSDPTLPRVEQGVKAGGHPLLPEDQTRPFGPRQGDAESSLPSAGTDHPDTWFHTPAFGREAQYASKNACISYRTIV